MAVLTESGSGRAMIATYKPGLLNRPKFTDWLSFFAAISFSISALSLVLLVGSPIMIIVAFLALGTVVLLWRAPQTSVIALFVGAVTIELFTTYHPDATTELVPFWRNLSSSGIAPLPFNPAELLVVATAGLWFLRNLFQRTLYLHTNVVFLGYSLYLLTVISAFIHGIFSGGNSTVAFWEIRVPFFAALAFAFTINLLHSYRQVHLLGWIIICGSGLKGIQGTWRYVVTYQRHFTGNELLWHDEALFFPSYYMFLTLLFVFGGPKRQKRLGLWLLPFVMIADFANKRRASTAALVVCLVVLVIILFVVLKQYRTRVVSTSVAVALAISVYAAALWNSSSTYAQPVRAIKSQFIANERDESSDRYRELEEQQLMRQINQHFLLGQGYGFEMPLAQGMVDLRDISPFMLYMPHNSVLWIWWRTGIIGFVFFWMAIAVALIRSCWIARTTSDPVVCRWAVFAVCVTVMHLVLSWFDQGLLSYRQVVYVWIVLAVPEVLERLPRRHNTTLTTTGANL